MKRTKTGRYVAASTTGEKYKAYIPDPLPPRPALKIDSQLREMIDQALLDIGRLDSISLLLPDTDIFLYTYVRKEAVLSSQIEGTQSSLSELLVFESGGALGTSIDDVQEVSNYVAAMNHGIKRIREGFPLCLRLIREVHGVLLSKGRGSEKMPGQFRKSQNWVGGTRPGNAIFVPPPPEEVAGCMSKLEKFLHGKPELLSTLLKAALFHVQFETIHPFLDGNGRLGRLVITLLLCAEGVLKDPMLYLSLYFKEHREEYYELLQKVRTQGDWEGWVAFFMTAICKTSQQATQTARNLNRLAHEDRKKIHQIKRASGSALRVHQALLQRPIISIPRACEMTGLWTTSVTTAMKYLEKIGIVREITGSKRNRLFSYVEYMNCIDKNA
jgi:Fic family protein